MGRIFYLDAVNGNDKNNGITPDEALKSLEAANRIVFGEGDKLLLKCGCVWKECFAFMEMEIVLILRRLVFMGTEKHL